MKILFLDIDGVLNSEYYSSKLELTTFYEEKKIKLVKEIVNKTKCKIVLTSLRLNFQLYDGEIKDVFKKEGLKVYDTLKVPFFDKANAINEWLSNNKIIVDYIVLDDVNYKTLKSHLVKTSSYYGLTKSKANKIISLFNKDNSTKIKFQTLLSKVKKQLKNVVRKQDLLDVFLDNVINICDDTYKNFHTICLSKTTYNANKQVCNEINNIIFLLHKYTFAVELLLGYSKEDIALEVKSQGIEMDEISNLLIKKSDANYDVEKSLVNIKKEIQNKLIDNKLYEIHLFKDEKDFNQRITCYVERVKGKRVEATSKAKELAKRFDVDRWKIKSIN